MVSSGGKSIYRLYRTLRPSIDSKPRRCEWEPQTTASTIIQILTPLHLLALGKNQAADALSWHKTNGLEDSLLQDYISVLEIEQNLPVSPNATEDYFIFSVCDDYVNRLPAILIELATKTTHNLNKPPALQKYVQGHSKDDFNETAAAYEVLSGLQYSVYQPGFLIFKESIVVVLQKEVPKSFQAKVLYLSHYPVLSCHSIRRLMYSNIHQHYHWPHMAKDVYELVNYCIECRRTEDIINSSDTSSSSLSAAT